MEVDHSPSPSSSNVKNSNPTAVEDVDNPPPPRTPSPDRVKCAICLGDLHNKSYSNTCIHQFCFGCLLEWSKVKPECPLCKSTFSSIYHNIRSISDYDEYVVPAPIQHLSIRVSSGSDRSPELLITSNNHDYSRSVAHTLMRDRLRDPRVLRLQFTPFGTATNDAIDVMLHGSSHSHMQENPFNADMPEFFGGALDLANNHSVPSRRFSGYQTRRRVYDRGQWVRPFDSTLIPGTVFFPSVEYFQRHPSGVRRISSWLHRELTVLMNLSPSRHHMAFAYDLVVSLLLRYDIRSPEFRDLMRPYLGSKTRQFQHEFYYFVLSGMRMEEYDRTAQYTTASSSSSSRRNREVNPINVQPTVVTLDSDDDQNTVEIVDVDDDESSRYAPESNRTSAPLDPNLQSFDWGEDWRSVARNRSRAESSLPRDNIGASTSVSPRGNQFFPIELPESLLESFDPVSVLNELEDELGVRRSSRSRSRRPSALYRDCDPEMPVLEPQVDLNNLSGGSGPSAFRRMMPSTLHPEETSGMRLGGADGSRGIFDGLDDLLHYTDSGNGRQSSSARLNRDPVDGRQSPYPSRYSPPQIEEMQRINRPIGSPDFPILTFRQNRERRQRQLEEQQQQSDSRRHRNYTDYQHTERPSCIHSIHNSNTNEGSSSSVQIRIFPPAMDLTTQGLNLSGRNHYSSDNRTGTSAQSRPRTPGRPPSPTVRVEDGDCEFLGVHPIVKKPPLAVITLSSEDENDDKERIWNIDRACRQVEAEAGPSRLPSSFPEATLPPIKRRHNIPPASTLTQQQDRDRSLPLIDVNAALSTLPAANLVQRHLTDYPMFTDTGIASTVSPNFEIYRPHRHRTSAQTVEDTESTTTRQHKKSSSKRKAEEDVINSKGRDTKKKYEKKTATVPKPAEFEPKPTSPEKRRSKRTKRCNSHQQKLNSIILNINSQSTSRSFSRSSSSSANENDSDDEYRFASDVKWNKLFKNPIKKKTKKSKSKDAKESKRSKSKSSKIKVFKDSESESKTKRKKSTESKPSRTETDRMPIFPSSSKASSSRSASATVTSSTGSNATTSPVTPTRLKSVVVKVDKRSKSKASKASKKPISKPLISSSSSSASDSSGDELKHVTPSSKPPTSRLRSVIASVSGSMSTASSSQETGTASSFGFPTPSALDLSRGRDDSPYGIAGLSSFRTCLSKQTSHRWESGDDDEGNQNTEENLSDAETLLSVGGYHDDCRSHSSNISVGGAYNSDSDEY